MPTFEEQSAHALFEGNLCNLRITSSKFSSFDNFLLCRRAVEGVDLASPGLDSMIGNFINNL